MSPIFKGEAQLVPVTIAQVGARTTALGGALELSREEFSPDLVTRAEAVVAKAEERMRFGGDHTVVALAGATGSGKSSLFNALAGSGVATVGRRRPTTSVASAAVWGEDAAGPLLDWLNVPTRHQLGSGGRAPQVGSADGLVLLDLPDTDSTELEHRVEAERLIDLVDVFVWVTDPQKYADARLHEDFIAALSRHEAVMITVLNQADRLSESDRERIVADLRRLLSLDGITAPQVLATSATTGQGVEELLGRIVNVVTARGASRTRLDGDIRTIASKLRQEVSSSETTITLDGQFTLIEALSVSAGVPTVAKAVERGYLHEAIATTGWPLTRWWRRLLPSPLRRLHLNEGTSASRAQGDLTRTDVRNVLGRSSLPTPSPAARAAVDLATRQIGEKASAGLPSRWATAISDAAMPPGADVADALDQAVLATPIRQRDPRWWSVVGLAQLILFALAVAGLLWLGVLAVLGWAQLPEIATPRIGPFAVPFLMLLVGFLGGILLAALSRWLARIGARRRAHRVRSQLEAAVGEVAERDIIAPVQALLERHAKTRALLDEAAR